MAEPMNDLAWIYLGSHRTDQALGLANLAVQLRPDEPRYMDTLKKARSESSRSTASWLSTVRSRRGRSRRRGNHCRVIDWFGLTAEEVRTRFPAVYQHLVDHVKPERGGKQGGTKDSDKCASRWWLFGKTRSAFRPALRGLRRYIATAETAKHRFFVSLDASILPDNMLVNIASSDAYVPGVLAEQLDSHRKRCQEGHPNLTPSSASSSSMPHAPPKNAPASSAGSAPNSKAPPPLKRALAWKSRRKPQAARAARLPWPPYLPDRVHAVRDYLMKTPTRVRAQLPPRPRPEVTAILETLTALGHANHDESGYRA